MWVLVNDSNPERAYCLLSGRDYAIGRTQGDITVEGDISISRRHGLIRVRKVESEFEDAVTTSSGRPVITLEDLKSTFGTYVGEEAILTSGKSSQADKLEKPCHLAEGIRIRFGLHSTIFKLCWKPVVCTTSSLPKAERTALLTMLNQLNGAQSVDSWTDRVTHVVMSEILLTVKVINALAKGIPIVTSKYFTDLVSNVETKQPVPNVGNYLPKLKESSLNASEVSCSVKLTRQQLFRGKTFLFASQDQMKKFESAIRYAGGTSVSFQSGNSSVTGITPKSVVGADSGNSYIVIHPTTVAKIPPDFKKIMNAVQKSGLSLIPEQNIGLAIIKDSCEIDCNPRKKVVLRESTPLIHSQSQMMLASATQTNHTQDLTSSTVGTRRRVSETPLTGSNRTPPVCLSAPKSSSMAVAPSEESDTVILSKQEQNITGDKEITVASERTSKLSRLRNKRPRSSDSCGSENNDPSAKIVRIEEATANGSGDELRPPPPRASAVDVEEDDLFAFTSDPVAPRSEPPVGQNHQSAVSTPSPQRTPDRRSLRRKSIDRVPPSLKSPKEDGEVSRKRPREELPDETRSKVSLVKAEHRPATSREEGTSAGAEGFLSKSMIKEMPVDQVHVEDDIPPEDVNRSYCQLRVMRLVRMHLQDVPTTRPDDLNCPVQNFKKFQKQPLNEEQREVITNLAVHVEDVASKSFMDEWCHANVPAAVLEEAVDDVDDLWNFQSSSQSSSGRKRVR